MKNIFRYLLITLLCVFFLTNAYSEEFVGNSNKSVQSIKGTAAGCSASAGFRYLDINNVNARINVGGDMWWDLPGGIGAQYFIPKQGTATSLFSGSLWIGGLDINNQLKLAAQRYRQVGIDYWPGPLTIDGTASVDEQTCAKYDKHFVVTRAEVDEFLAWWNSEDRATEFPGYTIPEGFMTYPAHGDVAKNQSYYLAPFKDVDGDGDYDPNMGDYPYYDITNELCPLNFKDDPNYVPTPTPEDSLGVVTGGILVDQVLKGDQTLWWVFNDKGNAHTETEGAPIGMEIRAQAFAFATNDEINNMTFYSYEVINRSTFTLTNTYFSPWVDTDLGYAWDDYVGCDVGRGLGYCYNGNAIDGSGEPEAYGDQPPAIGVDFFQGPYIDPDQRDNPAFTGDCSIITSQYEWDQMAINGVNFGNNIVDDERFGMRRFVYHNNSGGVQGDPQIAPEYYNYLRGIWKDNTQMLYGGNAHFTSGAVGPVCEFMFPDDSDPCNWGTRGTPPNGGFNQNGLYWNEVTANNNPDDRRFMQSAGPFELKPGAVNYITVGIPWARATSGGPWESVELLRIVDDKCQKLFDNCFKVLDGPDAPDLTIVELDKSLIFYVTNPKTSNNYQEGYDEYDNTIRQPNPNDPTERNDSTYKFEGYQIYQMKDASVTIDSRDDPNLVRLVAQYDVKNGVNTLVNYYFDKAIGGNVPVIEVEGGDNGISHSFMLIEDAFATSNRELVNHKQYYYTVIAYAFNEYLPYDQEPGVLNGLLGQKKPYLAGRRNIKTYSAIPHKIVNGTVMRSQYGDGPEITRIQGQGNGGVALYLNHETYNKLLNKHPADTNVHLGDTAYPIIYNPVYQNNAGPVDVRVIDPLNVKAGEYSLELIDIENPTADDTVNISRAKWRLTDLTTGNVYNSDTTIDVRYERLLLDLGLSVTVEQQWSPGDSLAPNNGLILSQAQYSDPTVEWLSGVVDNNVPGSNNNWIRSGSYQDQNDPRFNDWNMPTKAWDPNEDFEGIHNGTWAPYALCASSVEQNDVTGPAYNNLSKSQNPLTDIASVDIVLTPNKDLWTRCLVIEMCSDPVLAQGGAERFKIRKSPSVDKDGNYAAADDTTASNDPNMPDYVSPTGMGWFPGYAINVETGERLNIMFGEDSWLVGQNGRDMQFNPTSNTYAPVSGEPLFGGKHYVYIMAHKTFHYQTINFQFPAYDGGQYLNEVFKNEGGLPDILLLTGIYGGAMYVGLPLSDRNVPWLSNDFVLNIRVNKPYKRYYSVPYNTEGDSLNHNYPVYNFNTENISTVDYSASKAESDLDLINVVPNPYYAHSEYEQNVLDNQIRITYLPRKATISIYNVSGTLVRQFEKDADETFIDWDLKNFAGIPISSGIYLIHIKTDVGEKVIKWFGVVRPPFFNVF
ncbi:T9SS type A sorting domain-containing protein [Bacteroidota bacterium]